MKGPFKKLELTAEASGTSLVEGATYDAALVRAAMRDQYGSVLPFYNECLSVETEGPIAVVGPASCQLRGGLGGVIVRTLGKNGKARLTLKAPGGQSASVEFDIRTES